MAGPASNRAELVVVGLSHRTAPLDIRERLAFPDGDLEAAVRELNGLPAVGEAVLLSTCNRVEVYAAARAGVTVAAAEVRSWLAAARRVEAERLAGHLYEHAGEAAVRHVFRVAASLDSLVLGESQILGQLKSAYGTASQAGCVGPFLSRCLERAFGVAKRVRSETAIARGAANVSSVAVELAKKIFGDLAGKIVVLIGAGKMSDLAARHLRADGAADVLVTNRSPESAEELARKVDGKARPYEDLDRLLTIADVVISSTGSREPILSRARMKAIVKARRHRPLFLIDIAVPRDVEPSVGELDGVYLFDVDDLEKVVAENLKERQKEADHAERIVEHETVEFLGWMRAQDVTPTIKDLRERFNRVVTAEIERTVASLPPEVREAAAKALQRMADPLVGKLLHEPFMALRHGRAPEVDQLVAAARRLFALEDEGGAAEATVPEPPVAAKAHGEKS